MVSRRQALVAFAGPAGCPLALFAQQPDKIRRIGLLIGYSETDQEAQSRVSAFKQSLAALGWDEGRNLTLEIRWTAGEAQRASAYAKELVALQPNLLFAATTPATAALQKETNSIPIVFTVVSDPVGSGFVSTLSRPGGNISGFTNHEPTLIEKWVQLLKEVAPRINRIAVMFNPVTAPYAEFYMRPLKAASPKLGVTTFPATVRSEAEMQSIIAGLAREPNTGLVIMTDSFMVVHRKTIIVTAAQFKIPTIYFAFYAVAEGGLIGYGVDVTDIFRRAASYVDRILRGANVAVLPVEHPTKFVLAVNIKAASDLGLTVPQSILLRADTVVE